jgi:hypothetical protein
MEEQRKTVAHVGAVYAKDLFGIRGLLEMKAKQILLRYVGAILWQADDRDSIRFYHRHGEEFEARFKRLEDFQRWTTWAQKQCEYVIVEVRSEGNCEVYQGMDLSIGYGTQNMIKLIGWRHGLLAVDRTIPLE